MTPHPPTNSAAPIPAVNDSATAAQFAPGERLRITQQVPRQGSTAAIIGVAAGGGEGTFTGAVVGTVVKSTQQKTGSWYAHSRDGKLWLDRIELKKDDGELITLNIDRYTHIERL